MACEDMNSYNRFRRSPLRNAPHHKATPCSHHQTYFPCRSLKPHLMHAVRNAVAAGWGYTLRQETLLHQYSNGHARHLKGAGQQLVVIWVA